jgi:hypothetical protein
MDVCVHLFLCLCCPACRYRPCDELIPPSKVSHRVCKRSRSWKSCQGPTKGCRAIGRQITSTGPSRLDSLGLRSKTVRCLESGHGTQLS